MCRVVAQSGIRKGLAMNSNLARSTRTADSRAPTPSSSNSTQTLMDKWIEPPLRAPAPSFMDEPQRHIERHGVLQTMAPLGTPPSSKVKKAAKTEEPRKINLVLKGETSTSATPPPRQVTTPEPTVNPSREGSESRLAEDEDYDPKTPQAQTGRKSTTMRSSIPRQSLPPPTTPSASMSVSPTKEERELLASDRVVQSAVEEALTSGHICTAYALRTLYNDHRSNPRITSLMDSIFRRRADELQLREFASLMHYKKKEGRVGGKAKKWFDENDNAYNAPNLFSSSWTLQSSPVKRPALDSNSTHSHVSKSPHKEMAGHVSKKHKANNYHDKATTPETNGANGKGINGSLSRSRSNSTTSSLSSLDEELLNFSPANVERSQARAKANNSAHAGENRVGASTTPSQGSRNHAQPMAQDSTPGPKLHTSPTKPPITSSAPTTTHASTHLANTTDTPVMPIAYSEPAIFPQPQPSSHPVHLKLQKKFTASTPQPGDEDREDRLRSWKKQAKAVTDGKSGITDSFERKDAKVVERVVDSESDADSVARTTRGARSGTVLRFRGSQAARKANDESDDLSSPTLLSFQNDVAPGSSLNSRAGTPNTVNRPSRKPKGLGGLRTKTS